MRHAHREICFPDVLDPCHYCLVHISSVTVVDMIDRYLDMDWSVGIKIVRTDFDFFTGSNGPRL